MSLQHSDVGKVEGISRAKYVLDSSSRFDAIPACGGQTDGRTDGYTRTANTALA